MKRLNCSKFFALIITILLAYNAAGFLHARIVPVEKSEAIPELYPDEIAQYEIIIENTAKMPRENAVAKIVVSGSLRIIKNNEKLREEVVNFGAMQPGEKKSAFIKVKPAPSAKREGEKDIITLYYGFGEFTHFIGTYVEIIDSPVSFRADLERHTMNKGEENAIGISVKNVSGKKIENIKISPVVPPKFDLMEEEYSIGHLGSSDSVEKSFFFSPDPTISGTQHIAVRLEFEDEKGKHLLEKNLKLEIQDNLLSNTAILLTIAALIIAYIAVKREPGKKKSAVKLEDVPAINQMIF